MVALTPDAKIAIQKGLCDYPWGVLLAAGYRVFAWQRRALAMLADDRRQLRLVARQCGKSFLAAAQAVHAALTPESLVLIIAPTERQSAELLRYCKKMLYVFSAWVRMQHETHKSIELYNKSRILALPATGGTIRGFSGARLIIMDEDAQIKDDIYSAVEPMLHRDGVFIRQTTPFGRRGGFFTAWENSGWPKIRVTAWEVPERYSEADLRRKAADPLLKANFKQEYECEFIDTVDAVFHGDYIMASISHDFTAVAL